VNLFKLTFLAHYIQLQYGDGAGNIAKENSSVFSLIQNELVESTMACGQSNSAPTKSSSS